MRDQDKMARAILEVEQLLAEYATADNPNAALTLVKIIGRLNSDNVVEAAKRVQAGFGTLKIVK